ncbi:hypothetical protein [Psychrobacter sp. 72-O-c]|uniref:hypothetical protein n=1 Tax=Psychrobacter sp. 72-O-c TaxID=2774125 RepID=UPI001919A0B0|nr:hypothetical protein [Psychrobacter sp. 72-O-c]
MLSPSLLRDYHQTNYCFGNTILNINKPSSKATTILKLFATDGGLFITAWNPLGKGITVKDNEQAKERYLLLEALFKKERVV